MTDAPEHFTPRHQPSWHWPKVQRLRPFTGRYLPFEPGSLFIDDRGRFCMFMRDGEDLIMYCSRASRQRRVWLYEAGTPAAVIPFPEGALQ